jgi:hypothetical protein
MKKFIKFLGIFVLILGISAVFSTKSMAADQADIIKIMNHIENNQDTMYEVNPDNDIMKIYENTGQHDYFPTTWTDHYFFVIKRNVAGVPVVPYFSVITRDYQNFYTSYDAKGFVMTHVVDYNNDGKVDDWFRDFVIILDDYIVLRPKYPEGYLNFDWFELSREEAQAIFDEEVRFAVEKIEGGE